LDVYKNHNFRMRFISFTCG